MLENNYTADAFTYAGLSDKGNYRSLNEDTFKACPEIGLWIVADGMGGHDGGDIASQLAVDYIAAAVKNGSSLVDAIQQVHTEIFLLSKSDKGKPGMGTTVVAVQITGTAFEVAWVGDSRAYLFQDQQLAQLSRDHSLVQKLIDTGQISEGQAKIHPQRNVISQALGGGYDIKKLEVDVITGRLEDGILLLCSDGLSGELRDSRIESILAETTDLKTKAENLIGATLALEGLDNISVILIHANQERSKLK